MALGITDAVELTGRITELVKKGATIELQERLMDLREAVLNAKEEVLALREENANLKRESAKRDEVVFEGGVYWTIAGEKRDGPYCPTCQDKDNKLIRLQGIDNGARALCLVCHSVVGGSRADPYSGFRR